MFFLLQLTLVAGYYDEDNNPLSFSLPRGIRYTLRLKGNVEDKNPYALWLGIYYLMENVDLFMKTCLGQMNQFMGHTPGYCLNNKTETYSAFYHSFNTTQNLTIANTSYVGRDFFHFPESGESGMVRLYLQPKKDLDFNSTCLFDLMKACVAKPTPTPTPVPEGDSLLLTCITWFSSILGFSMLFIVMNKTQIIRRAVDYGESCLNGQATQNIRACMDALLRRPTALRQNQEHEPLLADRQDRA
jgi:hypothetical protein